MDESRNLVIIGAGPAGLAAAIYAGRARLDPLVLERQYPGGQAFNTDRIDNYPGFPDGVSGPDLTDKMVAQAKAHGAELVAAEVVGSELTGQPKVIRTTNGDIAAHSVIVASGAGPRKLAVPGEAEFAGRGVSYCATCDGPFFRDRAVAVVGGGDSALTEALFLARLASKVYVIHRRGQFRAVRSLQERAAAEPRIELVAPAVVERIEGGDGAVAAITLRPVGVGPPVPARLAVDGVFIYVGSDPATGFLAGQVELDEHGYVVASEDVKTSVAGVFVAGDVRSKGLRQIVTACGDGAVAATCSETWLAAQGLLV